MVRVRILQPDVKYAGRRHSPGSILRDVPITTARRWAIAGQVEYVGDEPAESHSDQAIEGVNVFVEIGLTEPQAEALIEAGYGDLEAARAAEDDLLGAVDGIGPAAIKKIREA